MGAAARAQRGMVIAAGDRFLRGLEVVEVEAASDDGIRWRSVATGETIDGSRRAFAGRALTRIKPPPQVDVPPALVSIWTIAGAAAIPTSQRVSLIRRLYGDQINAMDGDERATVDAWLASLRSGAEPDRKLKIEVSP